MIVVFKGRDYQDFEKNPKIRSQWGEDVVKYFFESKGFRTFKTDKIDKEHIKIERVVKLFVERARYEELESAIRKMNLPFPNAVDFIRKQIKQKKAT